MPLVARLFFQWAGDGVMVIHGFHFHTALRGSQLAEPVTVLRPPIRASVSPL